MPVQTAAGARAIPGRGRCSATDIKVGVHVTLTRTRSALPQPIEIATIAGEEMLRWLQQIDGFQGLLMLSNEAEGITLALSFWESGEIAERHRAARIQFRDRVTAAVNVQVEETVDYEVTFAHLASPLVEPKK
jgi:hypothetical protein